MKRLLYNIMCAVMLTLLQSACVREFPGVNPDGTVGVDPTLVSVDLDLAIDLSLEPLVVLSHSRYGSNVAMRFVVEFTRDGKVVERMERLVEPSAVSSGKVRLPLSVKLHALEYKVAVWGDYVTAPGYEPLCFDASYFYSVGCKRPYVGNMDDRQCFCGVTSLDLRPWRDRWNASVTAPVKLIRPQAKYRIIATDVDELLSRSEKARAGKRDYTMKFRYEIMPWSYDVWSGAVDGYESDVEFTLPIELPSASDGMVQIGFDWLFADDNINEVVLTLTLYDDNLIPVSHVAGIAVPLRRGRLTTVTGDFLTNEVGGAITIDREWDGTIEIDADVI